jgi:hypothetical protein
MAVADNKENAVPNTEASGAPKTEAERPLLPEVLDAPGDAVEPTEDEVQEQVTRPTKLIRIAAMVRSLLDEARRAPLDDVGRRRLREIHERSVHELEGILSEDLRTELAEVTLPFTSETPTESELRIAQAQLVGWLDGIQATLFTQQAQAQSQFEEMRQRRAIEGGPGERTPGAYL